MAIMQTLRNSLHKRALYKRTKHELRAMPQDVAIDLGIFREDAAKIAAQAVYGK